MPPAAALSAGATPAQSAPVPSQLLNPQPCLILTCWSTSCTIDTHSIPHGHGTLCVHWALPALATATLQMFPGAGTHLALDASYATGAMLSSHTCSPS